MTVDHILKLAELIPEEASFSQSGLRYLDDSPSRQADIIERYIDLVDDPKFGWKFVRSFVDLEQPFPAEIMDDVFWACYNFEAEGIKDRTIIEAISFAHPRRQHFRNFIHAFLIDRQTTFEKAAKKLCIPEKTLQAYEHLFFNVKDRIEDNCYISKIVYPEHRQIEFAPNYIQAEAAGYLMLRASLNFGIETVLTIGGFPESSLTEFSSEDKAQRLESMIMGNGLLMSKLGALNQGDMPGITHARAVITSSKLSGMEDKSDDERTGLGAVSMGGSIMETLKQIQSNDITRRLNVAEIINKEADRKKAK